MRSMVVLVGRRRFEVLSCGEIVKLSSFWGNEGGVKGWMDLFHGVYFLGSR